MRLDLPRYHCVLFQISSFFAIPAETDANVLELMDSTHSQEYEDEDGNATGRRLAVFGTRSRIRGVAHRIEGTLTRDEDPSGVAVGLSLRSSTLDEDIEPPPRSYAPVARLIDAAPRLFGRINVTCKALFQYDRDKGYRTAIPFPYPLMLPDPFFGVTHLESASFSRRGEDGIEHKVSVFPDEDANTFWHTVDLPWEMELDMNSLRALMGEVAFLSSQLLALPREGLRGD